MKKKRISGIFVLLVVFLLVSVLALGGCDTAGPPVDDDDDNGAPDPAPDPPADLKVLTVALNTFPVNVDPANHRHRNSQTLVRNWTDALTQQTPGGQHILDIAEAINQVDELTYQIKIREGITFHNGDPLTADDVIFTYTRLALEGGMEGETSPRRPLMGPVIGVDKVDKHTVTVRLSEPNPLQGIRWYNVEIMPKNYFEEVGLEGFLKEPIGVGPFKWVEGDITTEVILERYENYYGGAGGLPGDVDRIPALDRVIFKFIPESTTRVAALLAGEVDIIQGVPFDSIQLLESNPGTRVASTAGTNWVFIAFNTQRAPFNDKRVRQAVAHAIDYDAITDQLLLGYSDPLYGRPFMEPHPGEAGSGQFGRIQPFEYNTEKARALMDEAGAGSNIPLVIDTTAIFSEEAQAVSQMLSDIGFEASVRVWDFAVLTNALRAGERQMYYGQFGNAGRTPHTIEFLFGTGRPNNYTGYSNPYLDELFARIVVMEDSPERNALLNEGFEMLMEEVPVLLLHNPSVVEACRSHVKNFYPSATGRVNLHRVDIE